VSSAKDLNDRAREGTLPADPASETVPVARAMMHVATGEQPDAADSREAERAICGALMWAATYAPDAPKVTAIVDMLPVDRFGDARLGAVFAAIVALDSTAKIADAVSVRSAMSRVGARGPDARELDQLVSLATMPTAERLRQWAGLVNDAWKRRQIMARGEAISRAARTGSVEDAIASADSVSALIGERESATVDGKTALNTACRDIFDPRVDRGVSSGIRGWDAVVGPLRPGFYTVIGAATGDGKTALGLTLAGNVAAAGGGVLYGSTEMPSDQLMLRLACSRSGVNARDILRGDAASAGKLAGTIASFAKMPIEFLRSVGMTAGELEQSVRRVKANMAERGVKLRLIVADYIQEMTVATKRGEQSSEEQRLRNISSALNDIAKTYAVHVIALAQTHPLNNAKSEGGDGKPDIRHLAGAKSIARPAETVLFVHRSKVEGKFPRRGPAELVIRKSRWGARGDVPVLFDGPLMRFEDDPERPHDEENER
jgi:replicative DNA helicase